MITVNDSGQAINAYQRGEGIQDVTDVLGDSGSTARLLAMIGDGNTAAV